MRKVFTAVIFVGMLIAIVTLLDGCGGRPNRNDGKNQKCQNEKATSPTDTLQELDEEMVLAPPFIKIFVENSGSMDGYVSDASTLRDFVEEYLGQIEMSDQGICGMECYFINSSIIKVSDNTQKFADKLSLSQFQKNGGQRGSSEMADIFDKILPQADDTVCIFISDCIFSPGKNKNADDYLNRQGSRIQKSFYLTKAQNEFSTLVYQVNGKFQGKIGNKEDKDWNDKYNGNRPFYVWVIGADRYLKQFRDFEEKLISPPFQNLCVFTHNTQNIDYAVIPSAGNYELSKKDPKHAIVNARLGGKGGGCTRRTEGTQFTFAMNVNFSNLLVDEYYLLDKNNYVIDNTHYRIDTILKSGNPRFTHTIKLSATSNTPTKVIVSLLNQMPSWIEEYTDETGSTPNPNDSLQRTYGLKTLMGAVYGAYTQKGNTLCEMEISINQNK